MTKSASSSVTCPGCGVAASGKFCHNCGASLPTGRCPQCDRPLPPGARFCNECGASVVGVAAPAAASAAASVPRPPAPRAAGGANASDDSPAAVAGNSPVATYGPWALAALLLAAVVIYFSSAENRAPATADAGAAPFAPFANGGGGGGAPPDISSMSPKERAQRLFDRVMRYSGEGKKDSLLTFAPMAIASFEMLGPDLDLDGRYDMARVALEADMPNVAEAQADTILQKAPTHLLGLALRARTAALKGDNAATAKALAAFASAKDSELAKKLPEYELHAEDINQTAAKAKGGK